MFSAFSKTRLPPELRRVLSCESPAVFLHFPLEEKGPRGPFYQLRRVLAKGRHLLQILLKAMCVLPVWATVCKDYSQELLHFNRKQLEKCYVKKHQPYQPKPVAAETVDPNKTRPNQVIFSLVLVL